ncbi:MAG TPA: hypothetical protein VEV81_02820 [Pyrinomonadaceae bacterium]|nr:hypothetical protein [Pyrinomonadaceae bacterium]
MKTFRLRNLLTLSLALSLLLAAANFTESSAQRRKQPPRKSFAGTALFVISGDEGSTQEYGMDALALFDKGKFVDPVVDGDGSGMKPFAEKYFQTGRRYRLLFGGGELGSATVRSSGEGCNTIHSKVSLEGANKIGGRIYALATDSETLGKRASSRRALTAEEREAVMKLVKSIYLQHKTSAVLMRSLKVGNLTATDLDGDGQFEVVGDFRIEASPNSLTGARRDLFLIASPSGQGFKAELANFQAYRKVDDFGRGVSFVDQLDIDGDGTGEVITINEGYDGYGYSIYKKRGGAWRMVYNVTGDAC